MVRYTSTALICVTAFHALLAQVKPVENPVGWLQTRWGMTVQQAGAVLGEKAVAISEDEARRRQWGFADGTVLTRFRIPDHELGGMHFEAMLGFSDRDGLQMVVISSRDAHGFGPLDTREAIFSDLERELTTRYGSPSKQVDNSERRDVMWSFSDTDVAIHLIRFTERHQGFLRLVYSPRGWDERWRREHPSLPP
jgi:hypothetical protein